MNRPGGHSRGPVRRRVAVRPEASPGEGEGGRVLGRVVGTGEVIGQHPMQLQVMRNTTVGDGQKRQEGGAELFASDKGVAAFH